MKAFRTLTVLIIALAALTACSSDNEVLNDQPIVNPTEPKTYTMIVQATKGDDASTTRGLSLDGNTLNVKWNEGEEVIVAQDETTIGTLTAQASTCGDITITGGTVTATGHWGCPGIGMGSNGTATDHTTCGDITIGGKANVTANKGSSAMHAIGFSYNGEEEIQKTCGTITIGDTQYYDGTNKTWVSETLENALKVETFTWPAP